MCEKYLPCLQPKKTKLKSKVFNLLLLDCWQREYDKRPYCHFVFDRQDFEDRMDRSFSLMKDFPVIIQFLHQRKLKSVKIVGVNAAFKIEMVRDFALGMFNLLRLELKMMTLLDSFFDQLVAHTSEMHLKELNLEGTKLSYIALVDLRLFLIESKHLRYLNVSNCDIDQFNFAILADGIHKSMSMRRFVCNRLLGKDISLDSDKISHTVASLIWKNKLEALEMQKCEFIAQDMELITEYLWNNNSVMRKLNFSCNIIGADGAECLFRAISHSGTLTHLDISSCSLGTHGGDVVAKYLSSCFQLEHLNITYNEIAAETMNNILTMMKKHIKELYMKLYGNEFNARSGQILNRLLQSRVVPQHAIDITVTYEEDLDYYRIVPYY